ncbi:ComF family protein [Paenibacillus sp. CAU 1782]
MSLDWFYHLTSRFTRKILHESMALLAPASTECLVCSKPKRAGRNRDSNLPYGYPDLPLMAASLCSSCLKSIPWMARIVCPVCGRGVHCEDCSRRSRRSFVMNRSAVAYDPAMREWLALYKYRGQERLAPLLGEMLLPACALLMRQMGIKRWDFITYVPVSEERATERGFNQAEEIARHLAGNLGLHALATLQRTRHAGKMSFKTRRERLVETESLFEMKQQSSSYVRQIALDRGRGLHILLVDDIYTTGSTAEACAKALRDGSGGTAAVYVATWARS